MTVATLPPSRTVAPPPAAAQLLSAEEFARLPDTRGRELVRGVVREVPMPGFVHGVVCNRTAFKLTEFVDEHDLGWVLTNDSHLPIRRPGEPDTVRGMDVAFFSWDRVPRDERPVYLPPAAPELIVEVRSPSDRPGEVLQKVGEYLLMGVNMVAVADPDRRTLHVYSADDETPAPLGGDAEFAPRDFLPGFSVRVADLFPPRPATA